MRIPEGAALTPDGLRQHREAYIAAMRAYNAGEVTRRMRTYQQERQHGLNDQAGPGARLGGGWRLVGSSWL